ncbi:MAG: hypothetical protein RLY16_1537 [Bacteroidota bacterium]|jgi:uncharacterized SAM-binding protein YcdF (DUF218 family)
MQQFILQLKGLVSVLHLILLLGMVGMVLIRYQWLKLGRSFILLALIVFVLSSTQFLPHFLAKRLEKQYPALLQPDSLIGNKPVYLHVLGSGYNTDSLVPPNSQPVLVALGRLAEAMRLYRRIPNSVIVCSGNSLSQTQSQAIVIRKAALALGVDSARTIMLETPTTTAEEAAALETLVGPNAKVVVVTDALHMPRAMKMFKKVGFKPIAAPTNYRTFASNQTNWKTGWIPKLLFLELSDRILHEYVGNLKAGL